jgi:hypothetical protein
LTEYRDENERVPGGGDHRELYPAFEAFMPAVEKHYLALGSTIRSVIKTFDDNCIHVTSVAPFDNHAHDVDPSTKEIVITTDKTLDPQRGYSVNYGEGGKDHFPVIGNPVFTNENKGIRLKVELKSAWEYTFVLTPAAFRSVDGYPLRTYMVEFKTSK